MAGINVEQAAQKIDEVSGRLGMLSYCGPTLRPNNRRAIIVDAFKPPPNVLPQFPWPPPAASGSYVLPDNLLQDLRTVGEAATANNLVSRVQWLCGAEFLSDRSGRRCPGHSRFLLYCFLLSLGRRLRQCLIINAAPVAPPWAHPGGLPPPASLPAVALPWACLSSAHSRAQSPGLTAPSLANPRAPSSAKGRANC
jgi:hypothetical protein